MNIYVGNIPFSMTEDELREVFVSFGHVDSAKLIIDRETGRSRGFGFVEMSENVARKAITELNGSEYNGKQLVVNEAKPKSKDSGFSRSRRPW